MGARQETIAGALQTGLDRFMLQGGIDRWLLRVHCSGGQAGGNCSCVAVGARQMAAASALRWEQGAEMSFIIAPHSRHKTILRFFLITQVQCHCAIGQQQQAAQELHQALELGCGVKVAAAALALLLPSVRQASAWSWLQALKWSGRRQTLRPCGLGSC